MSANQIKGLQVEEIDGIVPANDLALAIKANLSVMRSVAGKQILNAQQIGCPVSDQLAALAQQITYRAVVPSGRYSHRGH